MSAKASKPKRKGGRPGNRNAAGPRFRLDPNARTRWLDDLRDRPRGRTNGATTAAREVPLISAHAAGDSDAVPPLRELTSPAIEAGPAEVFRAVRDELIGARGGPDVVSPQERLLIDAAAGAALQLAYVDAWIARQPTFIKPNATVLPIIETRHRIAKSLVMTLRVLGLDRRAKDVETLESYIAKRGAAPSAAAAPPESRGGEDPP